MESYKNQHERNRRTTMNRLPLTWTALQVALATAAAWLLCETDALRGAAAPFFH
jgi:hypothetical protein